MRRRVAISINDADAAAADAGGVAAAMEADRRAEDAEDAGPGVVVASGCWASSSIAGDEAEERGTVSPATKRIGIDFTAGGQQRRWMLTSDPPLSLSACAGHFASESSSSSLHRTRASWGPVRRIRITVRIFS